MKMDCALRSGLGIVRKTLGQHEIATVHKTAIDQTARLVNLRTILAQPRASDWPVCPISEMAEPWFDGTPLKRPGRWSEASRRGLGIALQRQLRVLHVARQHELGVARVAEVVERVHAFLPIFPPRAIESQLLDAADLAIGVALVELFDREVLADVSVHAAKIGAAQIVEVTVHARQVRRLGPLEDGQGGRGRAVVVEIEGDESDRRLDAVLHPLAGSLVHVAQDQFRTAQPGQQLLWLHLVEARVPNVGQVAIVHRRWHALARVETDDIDLRAEVRANFEARLLQCDQAAAAGDPELDGRHARHLQLLGQKGGPVDAVGVVRIRIDPILDLVLDRARRESRPNAPHVG